MTTPLIESLVDELWTAETELFTAGASRYALHANQPPLLAKEEDPTAPDPLGVEREVDDVLFTANLVVLKPPLAGPMIPRRVYSPLAKTAIATANHPLTRQLKGSSEQTGGCLEAELRLVRALEFHKSRRLPDRNHRPGAILFDEDDKPFAYQKSSGDPTAYVWRDGILRTREGRRFLPASSFVELEYKGTDDPMERFVGAGLLSLKGFEHDAVRFLRFSTRLFSSRLAYYALLGATIHEYEDGGSAEKLHANLAQASKLDNRYVAEQIHALLRSGRFVPVMSR